MEILKFISRHVLSLAAAVSVIAGCTGNEDDGTVPEGTLRIFADVTTITADGSQTVVFRVMYGSQDVSTSSEMNLIRSFEGDESRLAAGVNVFSTTTPGTYTFTARYFDGTAVYTDNEVTVTALPSGEAEVSSWFQKVLGIEFTSTTCIGCPDLVTALHAIESERPGVLCPVAFHMDYQGPDPMTIAQSQQFAHEFIGTTVALPALFFNMHQPAGQQMTNVKAIIDAELDNELDSRDPDCGVAVSSVYNASTGQADISVRVKSNVQQVCRIALFLVEDGIVATQIDDPDFVHDNVVRTVLTSGIYGDYVNDRIPLYPGTEYEMTFSAAIPSSWNPSEIRAVASVLVATEDGRSFEADNTNDCALDGGSSGYLTVEN